jgi:GntR family transcriptional repressor for pyruvate dehydrogenase complex
MQSTSRSAAITAELRDEILRGQYRSGERLPSERDLAERFGVHRGAVREALKRLEQLGLADIRPGGARVAPRDMASLDIVPHLLDLEDPPDPVIVDQVLEIMSGLFSMAARLATERADDEQRAEIMALIEEIRSDESDHPSRVHDLGDLFVEASGNFVMRLMRRSMRTQFMERLEPAVLVDAPPAQLRTPHIERIGRAVEARDGSAAAEAVLELTRAVRAHTVAALTAKREARSAAGARQ